MTEVTEWDGKPRSMWVWDRNERDAVKKFVVYIASDEECKQFSVQPVMTPDYNYLHCAEIEEDETLLNNYELGQLFRCMGVEWKQEGSSFTNESWFYTSGTEEETPLPDTVKIRYKQGAWEEPTRETVRKWLGYETPDSDISRFISFIGWDRE